MNYLPPEFVGLWWIIYLLFTSR